MTMPVRINNNKMYYIAVDENGQAYISHGVMKNAFGKAKGWVKKNAKYIQKITENGRTRYFYDPEEWRAYVEGKGKRPTTIVGKAKDKLEFDKRDAHKLADQELSNAERKQGEAWRRAGNSSREAVALRDSRVSKDSAYAEGVKERSNRDYEALLKSNDDLNKAREKAWKANSDYEKTGLYKVEKFAKNPAKAIGNAVEDVYDDAKWEVEDKIDKAREKITDKKMSKDPKVVKATKAKAKAEAEFDRVEANLKDYCDAAGINLDAARNYHTDDPTAKKLAEKYWDANDDLRNAYNDYSSATKKYGKRPVFAMDYTQRRR